MRSDDNSGRTSFDLQWVNSCDGAKQVSEFIRDLSLNDIGKHLIILPTSRMSQELKLHIAGSGGALTGCVHTVSSLAHELMDDMGWSKPIIDLTTRDILIQSIMEKKGSRNFSHGKGVRGAMASSISKAIGELIREDITPEDLTGVSRSDRSRELAEVYEGYLNELEERSLTDSDSTAARALSLLKGSVRRWEKIVIYMPGKMPAVHRNLIQEIVDRSKEVVVREHSSRKEPWLFMDRDVSKAGRPEPYVPDIDEQVSSMLVSDRTYTSITGKDQLECFRKVMRSIKSRSLNEGMDPSSFTIVLPVKQSHDRLLEMVAAEYGIEIDTGKDLQIESVPLVNHVLELLRSPLRNLPRSDIVNALSSPLFSLKEPGGNSIRAEEIEIVTRQAGISSSTGDHNRDWIDPLGSLTRRADLDKEMQGMVNRVVPPLTEMIGLLGRLGDEIRSVDGHYRAAIDMLKHLDVHQNLEECIKVGEERTGSSSGEGPGQINMDGLKTLYSGMRTISRISRLLDLGSMDLGSYIRLLEMELNKRKVRSTPRKNAIQVLGIREASGLQFELAYLCSMVEGEMPPYTGGFQILGDVERMDLGLPPRSEPRQYLEDLGIIMSSSGETVICRHLTESDDPVSLSPFLEDLDLAEVPDQNGFLSQKDLQKCIGEISDPSYPLKREREDLSGYTLPRLLCSLDRISERVERSISASRSRKGPDPDQFRGRLIDESSIAHIRSRYGDDHVWSVSQLEAFRKCGFSFFSRYVLGLKELEDLDPGIPPEKKGLIFHEVVERFYRNWFSMGYHRMEPPYLDEAWALMMRITGDVMSSYNYKGPYWDALRDQLLGTSKEKGLLMEFLEIESVYDGPFRIHRTELSFGMGKGERPSPVSISLPGDEYGRDSFSLRGSIDRVDVLRSPGGSLSFIWDYKTGGKDVDKESLQVPLYLAAMRKVEIDVFPGGGGYYYVRKRGSIRPDPILGSKVWSGEITGTDPLQEHIDGINDTTRSAIEESLGYIDSIRSGEMVPDPKCSQRNCPYMGLCRRGDRT